jgi:hypothetical protein
MMILVTSKNGKKKKVSRTRHVVAYIYNLNYWGEPWFKTSPDKVNLRPYLKNKLKRTKNKQKRTKGMAQVVEYLLSR